MIKRFFFTLAIVAGIMLALGCTGNSPLNVKSSADPSIIIQLDHQYPQMYTPYMLENMDAIEKENGITWLGCYDDGLGAFILWHNVNETGECKGSVLIPGRDVDEISCDQAWEIYLEVCAQLGNCQQLI